MNSTKDTQRFQHQIQDPNLSIDERALLRCRWAKQLEEVGNYDAGREAMGELWEGIGERPKLDVLDQRTAAEVLLRAGTLTGWIGITRQIEGAQEIAKNLITESIGIFESLNDVKKVAEAETEIAVCYRREGALDNARVVLSDALSKLDDNDGDLTGVALLRSAFVEKTANRFKDAFNILSKAASLFDASTNDTLKGRFHNEFAIVLENLGAIENVADYLDRATIEYTAASYHFEQAGHSRYQACVENNLAMLYLKVNRVSDAHEHLDRAQALFTRLDDTVHLAQVDETRARAWLTEGAFAKAEKVARLAVKMLDKGDEPFLLAEALITHGIALSHLHQKDQAQASLERASEVAERAGDLERAGLAAITVVETIGPELSDDALCEILERARELLKNNPNPAARERLLECAFRVLSLVHTFHSNWTNYSFDKSVHRYEERQIRRALEDAGGVISQAARLLGLTHQRLHQILKNRHKNLRDVLAEIIASGEDSSLDPDSIQALNEAVSKKAQTFRILHVEDNQVVADAVRETLQVEGWEVETCADGAAGLKKILGHDYYDLLLLDYDLPGVSGIELVRRARGAAHRQNTPIIVLSAALGEAEAREAGSDKFLHKPEDIRSLLETISELLSSAEDKET